MKLPGSVTYHDPQIGDKAWCESCELALVYDWNDDLERDEWSHMLGNDLWELCETTKLTDRIRMFIHGYELARTDGGNQ